MATNRDSAVINVVFRIPDNFAWASEEALTAYRTGDTVSDTIEWTQGDPEIASFEIGDIEILFFSNSAGTTEIGTEDNAYDIGDQTLAQIITLTNFIDDGDGTGSVDVQVDPSGIDASELTVLRNVYIRLRVSQPDPGD